MKIINVGKNKIIILRISVFVRNSVKSPVGQFFAGWFRNDSFVLNELIYDDLKISFKESALKIR